MAYRELRDGDLVRVVGKGQVYNGCNAIVIDAGEFSTRVQLQQWQHLGNLCNEVICETIINKNLIIRNEPYGYIVDGRIDHEKKSRLEARRDAGYNFQDDDYYHDNDDLTDDETIMQQLLQRVATLEKEMLDMKRLAA